MRVFAIYERMAIHKSWTRHGIFDFIDVTQYNFNYFPRKELNVCGTYNLEFNSGQNEVTTLQSKWNWNMHYFGAVDILWNC